MKKENKFFVGVFIVTLSVLSIGSSVIFQGSPILLIPLFGGICLMPIGAIIMMQSEEKTKSKRVVEG